MPQRRQLPPQIRRIELASPAKGKHVIQLTVDVGIVDAKRKQIQRRYATERQSRDELATIRGELVKGTYVLPISASVPTVANRRPSGLAGLEATTVAGNRDYTTPVIDALDGAPVHKLAKAHIDQPLSQLESALRLEETPRVWCTCTPLCVRHPAHSARKTCP
jgi:integrase